MENCDQFKPATHWRTEICGVQILMLILGSVHLVHLASVIRTPPVIRLHLTCVPVTRPAATGVNVIKDTSAMDWTAQVSYTWCNCCQDYTVDSACILFIKWKISLFIVMYRVDPTSTSSLFYRRSHLCCCRRPLDLYCPSGHSPCSHGVLQVTGPLQLLSKVSENAYQWYNGNGLNCTGEIQLV